MHALKIFFIPKDQIYISLINCTVFSFSVDVELFLHLIFYVCVLSTFQVTSCAYACRCLEELILFLFTLHLIFFLGVQIMHQLL